ncbi:ABC transporter ATP-binding protein [Pyramidobacter sp.]|uniref:ABC transporter ATP-binding protein n=1 Tax=Pyramidobacter sp. TaxID=1943581 RepID=UPI0025EF4AAF|nr:ABC transporter ATP-binding protein [Pyramidobacter sp.]MCI7403567.1 ABC transporter ATP-binding protein [Pyramidobacter sp.]MDY3211720.1 ABC transporter ATP-binding protein [Pyramidobacter sp.]
MSRIFSLRGLRIAYARDEIIHSVSFDIHAGEFCALLGLNGSGKTTILHASCGLLPMSGSCAVNGQDCSAMNERERARLIAFIPQNCGVMAGKTALEIVMMGFNTQLGLFESPSKAQKQAALVTLDRLGCAAFARRDFAALSQGQRQIVILARCLVQNTPVMLMDEPDSALDFLNRQMVLEKIRSVIHSERKAGLITLHDPNFAMRYCDRLLLLKAGALTGEITMKDASREELREKLSLVYGDIELFPCSHGFFMAPNTTRKE